MSDPYATSSLAGKVAVVTGAAQGIGEATARLFCARGAAGVVLVDVQAEKLQAVEKSLQSQGFAALAVPTDLADADAVVRVMPAADARFGRVDILANVAGLTDRGGILDTDVALFDRMFAVNVRAPFFLMQGAIRIMEREKLEGAIVNILSVNAYVGGDQLAPYSASKGALLTLTKNTANAANWLRVRVNGITLGWVDTPGEHKTLKTFHDAADNWLELAEPSRPFGQLLKPEGVARVIAFLASAESAPMTGAILDYEQTVFGGQGGKPANYPGRET
jgi:NAD(P)-dependent dehydrogenase (short-subunit alcohol dehydrogenase family)